MPGIAKIPGIQFKREYVQIFQDAVPVSEACRYSKVAKCGLETSTLVVGSHRSTSLSAKPILLSCLAGFVWFCLEFLAIESPPWPCFLSLSPEAHINTLQKLHTHTNFWKIRTLLFLIVRLTEVDVYLLKPFLICSKLWGVPPELWLHP